MDVLRQTGKIVRLKLARYTKGPKYHQLQNLLKSQEMENAAAAAAAAAGGISADLSASAAISAPPLPSQPKPAPPSFDDLKRPWQETLGTLESPFFYELGCNELKFCFTKNNYIFVCLSESFV